jgi:signal transduction histidine kinase
VQVISAADSPAIRILLVEDSSADAELLLHTLERAGYRVTVERVETERELRAALADRTWDVVVSDYSLRQLSGPRALEILATTELDLPFIIVSSAVGEDVAVAMMREGASDYILKENLTRLGPAIEREVREAALRGERRSLEEQLWLSDRLASVGTLAAGVAHEINNPLAAIIANLELLGEDLAGGDLEGRLEQMRAQLADAREGADCLRHIVRDLKVFSNSPATEQRGPVDVERVLESALRMAWNELRHRGTVVREYGDVPPVDALEARLAQVFLNLVVRAAHAIREGDVANNHIRVATSVDAQRRVVIEIEDTGEGIAPGDLPHVFDAFYTTRPLGMGTGLGLPICHRIVTDLGGAIAVESKLGEGSRFRVTLPAARAKPSTSSRPARDSVPPRRARVLIIDDDPAIGRTLARLLGKDHDVTVAAAREALELFASGARFEVIFCDLMMPQVTGMDLHQRLAHDLPEQAERMVFITGGAFTARAQAFLEGVTNARIDKPFDTRVVKALVRRHQR